MKTGDNFGGYVDGYNCWVVDPLDYTPEGEMPTGWFDAEAYRKAQEWARAELAMSPEAEAARLKRATAMMIEQSLISPEQANRANR